MCCLSELILTVLYTGSSFQSSSEQFISCIHLSFLNLALHPNPQTKISGRFAWRFKQLCLSNHSKLDTCSYELFSHNSQYHQFQKQWPFLLNHTTSTCRYLDAWIPNTANSYSQHRLDVVLLTLEWPGNITPPPEIFLVFGGHSLYRCDGGSHYLLARISYNARKAAHRRLKLYARIFMEPKEHNPMLLINLLKPTGHFKYHEV